jgi:hypothetical protein
MNALKSLVRALITAAPTALLLFGSGAHGQEVRDLPPCRPSSRSTRKPISLCSFRTACRMSCGVRRFGAPGRWIPRSATSKGCRRTTGINDPKGVPGFGELGPEVDVKRMVAEIRGEAPRVAFAAKAAERTK